MWRQRISWTTGTHPYPIHHQTWFINSQTPTAMTVPSQCSFALFDILPSPLNHSTYLGFSTSFIFSSRKRDHMSDTVGGCFTTDNCQMSVPFTGEDCLMCNLTVGTKLLIVQARGSLCTPISYLRSRSTSASTEWPHRNLISTGSMAVATMRPQSTTLQSTTFKICHLATMSWCCVYWIHLAISTTVTLAAPSNLTML
jgi:hypothetical protein